MGNTCCCRGSSSEQKYKPGPKTKNIVPEVRAYPKIKPPKPVQVIQTPQPPSKPKIVVAVYNYEARDSQDLSFVKGDRMEVHDDADSDWLFVQHLITGSKGYIPGNFVAVELSVESEDWFFEKISRKEAEKLLLGDENQLRGTFLIRPSEHNPNGFSLSVKDWDAERRYHVKHYKIKPLDNGGYYISTNKTYDSLPELVLAYSKNAYGLCNVLSKPCRKPEPTMWDLARIHKDKWEISRDEIQLLRQLGKGNFGEVFFGKWKNQHDVAVKTLRQGTMSTQAFLEEAAIMKNFRHKRLVQLYGVCSPSANEPMYIILEYMPMGSLLDCLRAGAAGKQKKLNFEELVFIAYQVAQGMWYLQENSFIHRDLAARNVLLGYNAEAKISDFGLARVIKNEEYIAHGGFLSVKWMAPEAIKQQKFTSKSDVWSYGIFLMELFTDGMQPYQGIPVVALFNSLEAGYRMPKPSKLPQEIYDKMLECWQMDPRDRPTFLSLEEFFNSIEVTSSNSIIRHKGPRRYDNHELIKA